MFNQIAEITDCQYNWKKSINVLDFLIRDNNQGEGTSETNTFKYGLLNGQVQVFLQTCQKSIWFICSVQWDKSR